MSVKEPREYTEVRNIMGRNGCYFISDKGRVGKNVCYFVSDKGRVGRSGCCFISDRGRLGRNGCYLHGKKCILLH